MKLFGHEIHLSLRRRVPPEEMVCFGCGQDGNSARKLIAGPPWTFICDECVTMAELALGAGDKGPRSGLLLELTEGRRCSFCNKPVAVATAGAGVGICQECVSICQSIIEEDRQLESQRSEE